MSHDDVKSIEYFVNGESQITTEKKLRVADILQRAGFTPASEHRLTRDDGNKVLEDHEALESIHQGERFTATFVGPTPVS